MLAYAEWNGTIGALQVSDVVLVKTLYSFFLLVYLAMDLSFDRGMHLPN